VAIYSSFRGSDQRTPQQLLPRWSPCQIQVDLPSLHERHAGVLGKIRVQGTECFAGAS
jgi:hypothetical protein